MPAQYQTLIQMEQETTQQYAVRGRILKGYIDNDLVLQDIPLMTRNVETLKVPRQVGNLPKPGWRDYNVPQDAQIVTPETRDEQSYLITNTIRIDHAAEDLESYIVNPWQFNTDQHTQGVAFGVNYAFINNTHAGVDGVGNCNKAAFVGLAARLANIQEYGTNPDCIVNAGNLNLSAGNLSGTNGIQMCVYLDKLMANMGAPTGKGIILFVNDPLYQAWNGCLRLGLSGGFTITKDTYDRDIMTYKGAVIRNMGRNTPILQNDGSATQAFIISNTEDVNGVQYVSGSTTNYTYSSVYAIRTGEDYFSGWQRYDLKTIGPYPIPGGVHKELSLNWGFGLLPRNPRCIGRIYGVNVAGQ